MSINPNENINTKSFSQNEKLFLEKQESFKNLSEVIDKVSSIIIEKSRNRVLSGNVHNFDLQLFNKNFSHRELLQVLEEKEKQIITTSLQNIEFLLNKVESTGKEETSTKENVRFQDIDAALLNATKQLRDIKNTLFSKLAIKEEGKAFENIFSKEQEEILKEEQKLQKAVESVSMLLDELESGRKTFSISNANESLCEVEKILLEKNEKVKCARKATEQLIDSLAEIKKEVSFSPEEIDIFSNRLYQLKDSSHQYVLCFSQLATFTEATSIFFEKCKNLVHSNNNYDIEISFEESQNFCGRIKETLLFVQEKLRSFGAFIKSLFVKLFSFLSSACTSSCMCPLIMLRREKREKDLAFLENLFIEGKLSFGSSPVEIMSHLKLFLKLFGLDLLIHREEADLDYKVVVNISETSLSDPESLSNMMLSLVKYFENFSFEELLLEIDSFSNEKAEEVEQILSSCLEDLFAHNSWIFFEKVGSSENGKKV